MLKRIPRHQLAKLEAKHGTGRKARSFTRGSQVVHLLFMQLTAQKIVLVTRQKRNAASGCWSVGQSMRLWVS